MTRLLLLLCLAFVAVPRGAYAEDAATKIAKTTVVDQSQAAAAVVCSLENPESCEACQ